MSVKSLRFGIGYLVVGAALIAGVAWQNASHAQIGAPKLLAVSTYAPAEDLVAATDATLEQLGESLADPTDYAEDKQERVKKQGLLLATLAMHCGLHDQQNAVKPGSEELYKAALAVAKNSAQHAEANRALGEARAARTLVVPTGKSELKWEMIRGQGAMMKKLNEVHAAVKRNLLAARFEKQKANLLVQTASIGAIAQATFLDKHEVKNPAEIPLYEEYAVKFRTSAGELNKAVRDSDLAAATAAFERMNATCHDCHQKFVPPKK
ncbi:MAG: hypothetical protein QM811_14860 [Pirellulales bacterium]